MAETEELQIKVTLVEGNTVEKLREMRKEIEALGGGGTAQQLERFSRQARDAREKGLKPFSDDLEVAAKRMVPFIGGIGGIATGLIAVGYAADKALDALNDFTKVQERIGVLSKQTGFDPAFVKIFQEQFKLAGVEDATRDLQGLSHIMADITRANSEFRRKMMEGQKPGSAEAGAMQSYLGELMEIKDPTKFANKLREGLENIRKNAIEKFGEQRGAEAFRKFETELGMPDLDRLKKDLPAVSAEEKKLQADRQKAADDYLKTSREIDEHWEHIKAAWFDQTLAGSPLMDAMKYIEGVLARWEKEANRATQVIQQHPSPEGSWNKLNPFDPQVIEQRKALDPGNVSDAPLKKWWDENFGGSAAPAPETPAAPAPAKRLGLGRPKGGAVPLFGDAPLSSNIEDRRGEPPFQPEAQEGIKTQNELMEQTKRLAEDFERLFADYGGATGLAAQAGLNDIGGGGGGGRGGVGSGLGLYSGGTGGGGGLPHGSDVGTGTGPADGGDGSTGATGTQTYAGGTVKQQTAQTVANELRKQGLSENAIAGMMANVQSESGFNPALRHADQPKFGGEAHFAHGLFQEGGDEWNTWAADMKKRGLDPNVAWKDPAEQARFVAGRLKGTIGDKSYAKTFAAMQSGTKEQAAQAFVSGYLRPAAQYRAQREAQYSRGVPGVDRYTGKATNPSSSPTESTSQTTAGGGGQVQGDVAKVMKGVDPRLVDIAQAGAKYLPEGYTLHPVSGRSGREGQKYGFHPSGRASDWQIYGPDGKPIANRGDDSSGLYTTWARGAYTEALKNDPELAKKLGWGGAFATVPGGDTPDLMHLDEGGMRGALRPKNILSNLGPFSRSEIDAKMAQKVEGTGKLSVNVNAPKGTSVNAEGGGIFKKTEVTRQTQMEPAASSMASQYQE